MPGPKKIKLLTGPAKVVHAPVERARLWNFPKSTLEAAIKIPQAIEEKHAGKPWGADDIAKAVGYKKAVDWRFLNLLRSANEYGLVEGVGATAVVSMADIGNDIVSPSSPEQRQKALLNAFHKVDLFDKVAQFYQGKQIPEDEFFGNTLVRDFNVPRERLSTFIGVFTANCEYVKAFSTSSIGEKHLVVPRTDEAEASSPVALNESDTLEQPSARSFLDTCFVLMPFGEWHNVYYKEVYSPAIRDAGFEPVRADDLFRSGMVMEQVWEQIQKAKIILAELTGKNANVFYELGLSHALPRPVVILTASIEDVPYDLRHLRVIVYDTHDPNWGARLHKDITTYLKNTKEQPESAIPQPFRPAEDKPEDKEEE